MQREDLIMVTPSEIAHVKQTCFWDGVIIGGIVTAMVWVGISYAIAHGWAGW